MEEIFLKAADKNVKRAAILTLNDDLAELEELATSAGYQIVYEFIQRRKRPVTSTFVGKGKLKEITETVASRPVDVLLVNADLKPSQHYQLENELKIECIDRIRLVLNIFSTRAFSRESQLQVERAKLYYEIPFLKEWVHRAKAGEHPGFLGGGEYDTDVYYELTRKKLGKINRELEKLDQDRVLRRQQRTKRGFISVALAGYTNAGKSSLLNRITGEKALVENRMFSTLQTTTGRLDNVHRQILITDTIGFLNDLPHFLIESFKSTIEEAYSADLVLLLVDASDDEETMQRKLRTSFDVLFPEVDPARMIVVLSKVDLVKETMTKIKLVKDVIPCREVLTASSLTGKGIDQLVSTIAGMFSYPCEMRFRAPHSTKLDSLISWLYKNTEVKEVAYGSSTFVSLLCREEDHPKIVRMVVEAGGKPE